MSKPRALLLFSGGLDSLVAAKILQNADCEVVGLKLESSFLDGKKDIQKAADQLGIEVITRPFTNTQIKLLNENRYGFGKNMNPCIDCRINMLATAKKVMEEKDFDFVATGEVLGQRPFSQKKDILLLSAKRAGLEGRVLRPLSAKLLPETEMEKSGLIDREKLYAAEGRTRKTQKELAEKFGIVNFPAPAGGCLLTNPSFSAKLKELKNCYPEFEKKDLELLKIGRIFTGNGFIAYIGKDEKSNDQLEILTDENYLKIRMKDIPGPVAVVKILDDQKKEENLELVKQKIIGYSRPAREAIERGETVEFC